MTLPSDRMPVRAHAGAPCPCGCVVHGFRDHFGRLRCGSLAKSTSTHDITDAYGVRHIEATCVPQRKRASTSEGATRNVSRSPAAALRASRDSRLSTPASQDFSEDVWSYSGCAHDPRPLRWWKGRSPESLQRASFTDLSKHKDLLRPAATVGDYEKELAWKRAFGENPLEHSLQSTQRGDFSKVDFKKHRGAISPAATVYSKRRITDKKNRTLTATAGQRGGTETDNMRWWSAAEMASSRSVPTFTPWHDYMG